MKISAAFFLYVVIYHHYQHLYQQRKKLKDLPKDMKDMAPALQELLQYTEKESIHGGCW